MSSALVDTAVIFSKHPAAFPFLVRDSVVIYRFSSYREKVREKKPLADSSIVCASSKITALNGGSTAVDA